MECNNILLDYYKEEKRCGYGGSQLLSAGQAQLGVLSPLCLLQTFHTGLSIPSCCCLWSLLCHFSGAFLVGFVSGHTLVGNLSLSKREHITIEPLIKEIILDTWGNSCKALSDFQCIYFIHVILEVFLLWGMGMAVSVFESGQCKRKIISEMLRVLGRPQYSRNILFLYSAVPLTSHSLGFVFSFCVERQMGLVLNSKIFKV